MALAVAVAIPMFGGGTAAQAHEGHTSCKRLAVIADQFIPGFVPPGPGFGQAVSAVATSGPNAASEFVEIAHVLICAPQS